MTRQDFDALTGRELILPLFPCHHGLFSLLAHCLIPDNLTWSWVIVPPFAVFTVLLALSSLYFLLTVCYFFPFAISPTHLVPLLTSFSVITFSSWLCMDIYSNSLTGHSVGEGVNILQQKKKKNKHRRSIPFHCL